MTLKIALLLLAALLIVGVIGRSRAATVKGEKRKPVEAARRCPVCDAYVVGSAAASCDRADCPRT